MSKFLEAYKADDGHVQTVKIQVGASTFSNEKLPRILVCLVHKLQLLFENYMVRFPDGETVACNDQDEPSSLVEPCSTCCESCEL